MAKFITIGYGSREGYERTDAAVRDAAHAHDTRLRKAGPFMSSSLPVAGFAVIEAATLADVVKIVSQCPCAVAHGVIEVWPLTQAE